MVGCTVGVQNPGDGSGGTSDTAVSVLRNTGGGSFSALVADEQTERRVLLPADVSGDDRPDLITANAYGQSVSVSLNDGSGRFRTAVDYPVGAVPVHVVAVDFDGDGALDLATANAGSSTVTILGNNGNGTFKQGVDYAVAAGPVYLGVGDITNDGSPDLVSANTGAGSISILANAGNGAFVVVDPIDMGRFCGSLAVADVDGDGRVDIASANTTDRSVTVVRAGDRGFDVYPTGLWPQQIEAADMNADGAVDLITVNTLENTVAILFNDTSGRFLQFIPSTVGERPNAMLVAELSGDGVPDVATVNTGSGTVSVLINTGQGFLLPAVSVSVGDSPESILAADFNGDDAIDLATADAGSNTVSVLLNQGDGTFAAADTFDAGVAPRRLASADLDGDGGADLVVAGYKAPAPPLTNGNIRATRTHIPAPRIGQPDFVFEAYRWVAEVNGIYTLTDNIEWWFADDRLDESFVSRDKQWQTVLAQQNHAEFFIQMDPYSAPRVGALSTRLPDVLLNQTFASPAVREAFKVEALQRVRWYNPKYVCLGVDINAYYEQQPDDFENFVSLFVETRGEIKAIRPDTVVFVSFQYEQLLGRFGGLGDNTIHDPHWELFEMFDPYQDVAAISSFPLVSYIPPRFSDPTLIPSDYYSRIAEHTTKQIVFSALGWSAQAEFGSNEVSQAAFLRRFEDLTDGLDVLLVNYLFLSDTTGYGSYFDGLGLIDRTGQPRESLDVWNSLSLDNR